MGRTNRWCKNQWVAPRVRTMGRTKVAEGTSNSNMIFWQTKNVSVVPIHHVPPSTGRWWIGTRESRQHKPRCVERERESTNLVELRSTPRYVFLQLSVLPISTSRCPKDWHLFREPGRLHRSSQGEVGGWGRVPFSRNLMSPTPRRKWYLTTGRRFH